MKKLLFLFFVNLFSLTHFGQGCSDAGFCSLANTNPMSNSFSKKEQINMLRLGLSYGKAENSINAYNTSLEYTRVVNSTWSINTKLNFLAHSGNDVETGELGDVFVTADYNLEPDFRTTIGFKIPLHQGNKIKKGVVLPMDYQPTLGTLDFLFAVQRSFGPWQVGLGIQQPLTQNENQFFSNNFIADESFVTTNKYFRNADVWARLAYKLNYKNLTIIPSILPIYHLGNDRYTDQFGMKKMIEGSYGITLNAALQLDYLICKSNIVGLNLAAPLETRTSKPDGLARKYVMTLDYRHSF